MKKVTLLIMTAAMALFIAACQGGRNVPLTDTAGTMEDTTEQNETMSHGSPDTAFANKAAISGLAEVLLGRMAVSKGSMSSIKDFGDMMIKHHGKANTELISIAQFKNITLPPNLDAEHKAKSDSLNKLSGKEFDRGYAQVMVEGHQKTLALMKEEAANGKDKEMKAFAAKTAKVVEDHLEEITKIRGSIK